MLNPLLQRRSSYYRRLVGMLGSSRRMHDEDRTCLLDGLGNWRKTVFDPFSGGEESQVRQHNSLNEITSTKDDASAKVGFSYDGTTGASNGTTDYLYHGAVAQSQLARGHVRSEGAAYRAI